MDSKDLLQCPYEKSHRILRNRMQVHLGKCRRNHLNETKVTCPFNVTHILNKPELEFHISVCTERKTFENFKSLEEPVTRPTEPPRMPICESEDNWDDYDEVSYNPSEYVAKSQVLRHIQGVPPSERKKFRQQERIRLLGIEE